LVSGVALAWSLFAAGEPLEPAVVAAPVPELPPIPLPPIPPTPAAREAARAARSARLAALAAANPAVPATLTVSPPPPPGLAPSGGLSAPVSPAGLAFDAVEKTTQVTNGAADATFTFAVTNVSREDITILSVHTSCGCTAAKLPQQPWILHPGDHGEVGATMHVAGKWGTVTKTVTIVSTVGSHPLLVKSILPEMNSQAAVRLTERSRNLQIAAADRQAVFRNDCAKCHVEPTVNKTGKDLYLAACGVCHDAEHKASMVPALVGRPGTFDEAYWTQWVRNGKEGSLMPAFEAKQGGPLSENQINSLTAYLANEFVLQSGTTPGAFSPVANPGPVK